MGETKDFYVGYGPGAQIVATGRGRCSECKHLDTTTREVFLDGNIRLGRCAMLPIQPNGKWNDDWCDIITPEKDKDGVKSFQFATKS
jgi:hypothetical protein